MSYFGDNYKNLQLLISKDKMHGGFRRAQLGALYSIGAHFFYNSEPGIITMPTGSGKTAVIMCAPFLLEAKRVLIITPSRLVRNQISADFSELKTLKQIMALSNVEGNIRVKEIENVITGDDIEELKKYDVIVSTPNSIKSSKDLDIALPTDFFDLIIADEAHHSASMLWSQILDYFSNTKQILMTATPYRRDNKEIKGKFLYSYTMTQAYRDGVFGKITFLAVKSDKNADISIANETEKQFVLDKKAGYNHKVMVRTATKKRADELVKIYKDNTNLNLLKLNSDVSYSEIKDTIKDLKEGRIDGVICVDMMGEGFDFPNLKIAAVHAPHKSLEVTLQFIGRFSRTNGNHIGNAKFIAIPSEIEIEAEKIYNSDTIWSELIPHMSDQKLSREINTREMLSRITSVRADDDYKTISPGIFKPFTHSKIYEISEDINCEIMFNSFDNAKVVNEYRDASQNCTIYLLKSEIKPKWISEDGITDTEYHLVVVFIDISNKLVHINSSIKKEELYEQLINKITNGGRYKRIPSSKLKRVYRNIQNIDFFNIGLKSGIRSNKKEDYRIIAGPEVHKAITEEYGSSFFRGHSMASGTDKELGKLTLGYSAGSKVWSNTYQKIPEYIRWCKYISNQLININDCKTGTEFDNVPDTEYIMEFPKDFFVIAIIWDLSVYAEVETQIIDIETGEGFDITDFELSFLEKVNNKEFLFIIELDELQIKVKAVLSDRGMDYSISDEDRLKYIISNGDREYEVDRYLRYYQPTFYLTDFSAICNNELFVKNHKDHIINAKWFEKIDWSKYDIKKEFRKKGDKGELSIQDYVNTRLTDKKYEYCYYDHGTGEVADFISAHIEEKTLIIALYHCKGSSGSKPGNRVGDVYEVCEQVLKSSLWLNNDTFIEKITARYKRNSNPFLYRQDDVSILSNLINDSKRNVEYQLVVVQPGILSGKLQRKMEPSIASCNEYCIDNGYREIKIWCS